jgi:hypothetical protein
VRPSSDAAGTLGLVVPLEHGGAGGLAALAEACEAVGAACASTGMVADAYLVTGGDPAVSFEGRLGGARDVGQLERHDGARRCGGERCGPHRRRLRPAGFDRPTAERLSELHTPNLM